MSKTLMLLYQQYWELVLTSSCLSLALASRREDIDGVISLSIPLWLDPSSFIMEDYDGQVWFHRDMEGKEGIARIYHIHYEDIAVKVFEELKGLVAHLNEEGVLENIQCPTYIGQALDDQIAVPSSGKKIFNRISSTNKYLYEDLNFNILIQL